MSARPFPSSSYTRTFPFFFLHLLFTAQILNLGELIQMMETFPSCKPFSLPRAPAPLGQGWPARCDGTHLGPSGWHISAARRERAARSPRACRSVRNRERPGKCFGWSCVWGEGVGTRGRSQRYLRINKKRSVKGEMSECIVRKEVGCLQPCWG